jgi:DNA mismatch endonuclease (patch repair protein)
MAKVRRAHTTPELVVRRLIHALGFRFRLHRRDLPGTPDIVLPRLRKAVFVHGCFWHRHSGCRMASTPKTRAEFWQNKFAENVARDLRKEGQLRNAGWEVITVWECETKDLASLRGKLLMFLGERR